MKMREPPPWCFVFLLTLSVIKPQSAMVRINDSAEIGEFLFDCAEEPWLTDCMEKFPRRFFMLFDEQGNYLEELNKRDDSNTTVLVSRSKKVRRPTARQLMESVDYPTFLFQLEKVKREKDNSSASLFYIITRSGNLLAAENKKTTNLVFMADNTCTTPGVSYNNDCDRAKWTLWKTDEMFLSIESDFKKESYLNVANQIVTLGDSKEKMTGKKTSFYTGPTFTLDRSAGVDPGAGVGPEDYGDVVVHYKDRHGADQKAYVCDYEWGLQDAETICRQLNHTAGIPTFDGRYSRTKNPEYAVSGVQCEDSDFKDCKFQTICGESDPRCIVQQSMKQFEGKGYACNKGSKTDAAGVICGNQTTIDNILLEEMKCNRDSIENDRKSLASVYSIQNQIKITGSKVFENKHWSEYLLPMPMVISLMSTLLMVSSQFEKDVKLMKPAYGQWKHLEWDWLQPNLLFLSINVKEDFELSNSNMGVIKLNSERVHQNMKLAVGYAFSTNAYENKILLKRHLGYIEEDGAESSKLAHEVSDAFKNTGKIIAELLLSLKTSDSGYGAEKIELENVLKILEKENQNNNKTLEENKTKKEKYDIDVKDSREKFYNATNVAMNARCVDGRTECNSCKHKPAEMSEQCQVPKVHVCITEEEYCEVIDEDFWSSDECLVTKFRCIKHEWQCPKYIWKPEGDYCEDPGVNGICVPCDWITEVQATLTSVGNVHMQLQIDAMGDGARYSDIASIAGETLAITENFQQGLKDYSKWKDSKEKDQRKFSSKANGIGTSDELAAADEKAANRNIHSQLNLMRQYLDMDIQLLKEIKQPIAHKVSQWIQKLKLLVDGLINQNIQYFREITEEEKIKFDSLYTEGSKLHQEAEELSDKNEISFKPGRVSSHKVGAEAEKHTENLIERRKTQKNIESLANRMIYSMREIHKKSIKTQDLKDTIQHLTECLKYLHFLQVQWDSLKDFFDKLTNFLKNMKKDITRMKAEYNDIGNITLKQPLKKIFKDMLQTRVVEGLANNIYVMRIAHFYIKLAEDGLLEKMSEIGNNLQKIDETQLKNYLKYIDKEAIMVQENIKVEVSKEEAKLNDKITKEVSMMKNELACQFEDRKNRHSETILTTEDKKNVDKVLSSENNEGNVKDTFERGSLDEQQTLYDDAKLPINGLVKDMENYVAFDEDEYW